MIACMMSISYSSLLFCCQASVIGLLTEMSRCCFSKRSTISWACSMWSRASCRNLARNTSWSWRGSRCKAKSYCSWCLSWLSVSGMTRRGWCWFYNKRSTSDTSCFGKMAKSGSNYLAKKTRLNLEILIGTFYSCGWAGLMFLSGI